MAGRLLAEAGYRDTDNDGYVDKNGKNLELQFPYYAPQEGYKETAETISAYYKKVGVKANIVSMDSGAYYSEVDGRINKYLYFIFLFMGCI